MSTSLQVGDQVEWTSQAGGYEVHKQGEVICVIPPGQRPDRDAFPALWKKPGPGSPREHKSYVVRVPGRGVYWPRVSALRMK